MADASLGGAPTARGTKLQAAAVVRDLLASSTAERLHAYVVAQNAPSVRAAEKLGFVDYGPVERQAATGGVTHESLRGRRYVLRRADVSQSAKCKWP